MKILSLFSGIGAFEQALENLNLEYELVGIARLINTLVKPTQQYTMFPKI